MNTPELTSQMLNALLPPLILLAIVTGLASLFREHVMPKIKGHIGEAGINFQAKRHLNPNLYRLIANVTLPAHNGTTQIDHIIVSRYGIFVIETKMYKGWIYGGERDSKWTQVIYKRKQRFQNPLRQNYKHTKTLSDLTGIPHTYFKSIIVFSGEATFKTDMPANVVYARDFIRHINTYATPIITDKQVPEITDVIRQWAGTVSDKQRRQHISNLRRERKPVRTESGVPSCPRCESKMVLRTNRRDGSKFWGCPDYPKCRGTRSV